MHTLDRVNVGGLLTRAEQIIDSNSTRRHTRGKDHVVGIAIRTGDWAVEVRPRGVEPAAK